MRRASAWSVISPAGSMHRLADAVARQLRRLGALRPGRPGRPALQVPDPRSRRDVAGEGRPDGPPDRADRVRLRRRRVELRVGRRRVARAPGTDRVTRAADERLRSASLAPGAPACPTPNSPSSSPRTSASRASPTSNSCRSWSIRTTRSPATGRRDPTARFGDPDGLRLLDPLAHTRPISA